MEKSSHQGAPSQGTADMFIKSPEEPRENIDGLSSRSPDIRGESTSGSVLEPDDVAADSKWWKIHYFRGMIVDVRRRLPYYVSDWADAWDYRVVPATIYMYFAKYEPCDAANAFLILLSSFVLHFPFSVSLFFHLPKSEQLSLPIRSSFCLQFPLELCPRHSKLRMEPRDIPMLRLDTYLMTVFFPPWRSR
jgi:hypothetical protein